MLSHDLEGTTTLDQNIRTALGNNLSLEAESLLINLRSAVTIGMPKA
jgi:hypothetical protein